MNIISLLLVLLLGSLGVLLSSRWARYTALGVSAFAFLSAICMWASHVGGKSLDVSKDWIKVLNVHLAFTVDGLSLALILLTTLFSLVIILTTWNTEVRSPRVLYALILFMELAMIGTFASSDGLLYYIFWELSLIPIYFIILKWGNGDYLKRKKTVLTFFLYTFAGSLFMLAAIIYLGTISGNYLLADWMQLKLPRETQYWIFAAFFLAYAIKVPLIPFHSWQASTYQKAPAYGTMLLSGIMLKMGLYSILRWQIPVAPLAAIDFKNILIALSLCGVVYGALITLKQKNIKRFLAYSSLSHVGLIAAGAYTLTVDGMQGAVLQMLAHGLVVVGLFFAADIIYRRWNTASIEKMGGIKSHASVFNMLFLVIVFASISLPLTFNFVGEFIILYSLYAVHMTFAIIGGLTIILGAFYMLRMFQQVMLGAASDRPFSGLCTSECVVMGVIVLLLLVLGVYPDPIIQLVRPALEPIAASVVGL